MVLMVPGQTIQTIFLMSASRYRSEYLKIV